MKATIIEYSSILANFCKNPNYSSLAKFAYSKQNTRHRH